MKKKWMSLALLSLVSLVWTSAGSAAEAKKKAPSAKVIVLTPDDLQWKNGPAALPATKLAILEGDPQKPGFFVTRLKLPAGTKIPPHMHQKVERVTVISGKLYMAMGAKPDNPRVLPAGSYFSLPPQKVHNAWVDEETIVQIATNGPWTFKPVKRAAEQKE